MRIHFVIPALNERENLARLGETLRAAAAVVAAPPESGRGAGGPPAEIRVILVDDGSSDGTGEEAPRAFAPLATTVVRHPVNKGVAAAFRSGFTAALDGADDTDLVITLEADNTSEIALLKRLVDKARDGADLVLGSCYAPGGGVEGSGFLRTLLSGGANLLVKAWFGLWGLHTFSSFYRVHRAAALRRVFAATGGEPFGERGFASVVELLVRMHAAGERIEEVPVTLRGSQRKGVSKMRILPTILGYFRVMGRLGPGAMFVARSEGESPADPAPRPRLADVFAVTALAALTVALFARVHYLGVGSSDDYDYVTVARNIAEGRGITTPMAYPVDVKFFDSVPHAALMHPPGFPLLLAGSFAIGGVRDAAAVFPSLLAFILLVPATFLLAHRAAGRGAAWLAALLVATNTYLLEFAIRALPEMTAALLLTLAILAARSQRFRTGAVAAGLLLAAAAWVRESVPFVLPPLLALVVLTAPADPKMRIRRALWFVGTFIAGMVPLVVRSLIVTGKPWFSYSGFSVQAFTGASPDLDVLRTLDPPTLGAFVEAHPWAIPAKMLENVAAVPGAVLEAAGLPVAGLASAGLLMAVPPRAARVRTFAAIAILCTAAGCLTFTVIGRYFVPLVPLLCVVAGTAATRLAAGRTATTVGIVFTAWLFGSSGYSLYTEVRKHPVGNYMTPIQTFIETRIPQDAVVASDFPEPVAWPSHRRTVLIPKTLAELDVLRERFGVTHLLVTTRRTHLQSYRTPWQAALRDPAALPGWKREAEVRTPVGDAVLYVPVAPLR